MSVSVGCENFENGEQQAWGGGGGGGGVALLVTFCQQVVDFFDFFFTLVRLKSHPKNAKAEIGDILTHLVVIPFYWYILLMEMCRKII